MSGMSNWSGVLRFGSDARRCVLMGGGGLGLLLLIIETESKVIN